MRTSGRFKASCFLLLLVVMGASHCGWMSPPRQAILIVLDAARPDRFSAYGYSRETTPAMDRLAKSGVVFENTYTQATYTRHALPRLLYSRYFSVPMLPFSEAVAFSSPRDLFRRHDAQAMSLPRVLAASGYRTAAISAHSWISAETDFAQQFDEIYDLSALLDFDHSRGFPEGEKVIAEALK